MYDLIRFFHTKEEAEEFVAGNIRMNTLDYFWNHGLQDPRASYEGAVHPENMRYMGEPLPAEALAKHNDTRVDFRVDSVRYCNILSMMRHAYDRNTWRVEAVPQEAMQLGDYAVIVSNLEAFVGRLYEALKYDESAFGLMGPVEYNDRIKKNRDMDTFDRSHAFAWQNEWRFCYVKHRPGLDKILEAHPDVEYEIPVTLKIGDISAYCEIVSSRILTHQIADIYKGFKKVDKIEDDMQARLLQRSGIPVPYDTYCEKYVGFAPRKAFLGKVLEMDGARIREL